MVHSVIAGSVGVQVGTDVLDLHRSTRAHGKQSSLMRVMNEPACKVESMYSDLLLDGSLAALLGSLEDHVLKEVGDTEQDIM